MMEHFCKDPVLQTIPCTRPNTEESKFSNSAKNSIKIPVYNNSLCMTKAIKTHKKKKLQSRNFTQFHFAVHSTTLYKSVVLKDIT